MVICNVMFFGILLPNKASTIKQSQFRTKIKGTFGTRLHILIELQNKVLIYRARKNLCMKFTYWYKGQLIQYHGSI